MWSQVIAILEMPGSVEYGVYQRLRRLFSTLKERGKRALAKRAIQEIGTPPTTRYLLNI